MIGGRFFSLVHDRKTLFQSKGKVAREPQDTHTVATYPVSPQDVHTVGTYPVSPQDAHTVATYPVSVA